MKFSMNNAFWARALIALLFVYAGYGKLMGFDGFVSAMLQSKFGGLATIVGALVVFIEIVVALAFAFGYRLKWSALILGGFTALATILYHNPWAGDAFNSQMMLMALKNIAIIGGIWLASCCGCGTCEVKGSHHGHNH